VRNYYAYDAIYCTAIILRVCETRRYEIVSSYDCRGVIVSYIYIYTLYGVLTLPLLQHPVLYCYIGLNPTIIGIVSASTQLRRDFVRFLQTVF